MWLSCIDNCLCAGNDSGVREAREQFKKHFEADDVGPVEEYVSCEIEYDQEK